jgi:hypothetical protein
MSRLIFILLALISLHARAGEVTVLFVGNSYTYFPQDEADPGVPKFFKAIAESIDPSTHVKPSWALHGGYSFEQHLATPAHVQLMSQHYDHVVLQGQSMESQELTPWFDQNEMPGVKSFRVNLPKVLDLVYQRNSDVTLFVNWIWNAKHTDFQPEHPGLRFPPGHPRAGEKWFPPTARQFQQNINASYRKVSAPYPAHLALVGSAWLELEERGIVSTDELYVEGDWSHPSPLGSFIASLILVREVLHFPLTKNTFVPAGVDPKKARAVTNFLATFSPKETSWDASPSRSCFQSLLAPSP